MDGEKYVNDAVFRAEIRRIEQKVDNAVERMELKMDVYTSRVDAQLSRMTGRIDKLASRVDGISTFVGWVIGLSAIVITVGTFVIQILMK